MSHVALNQSLWLVVNAILFVVLDAVEQRSRTLDHRVQSIMLLECTRGHRGRKIGRIEHRLETLRLFLVGNLLGLRTVGVHDALTRRRCPASRCTKVFDLGAECTCAILRRSHQPSECSCDDSFAHRTAGLWCFTPDAVGVRVHDRSTSHRLQDSIEGT